MKISIITVCCNSAETIRDTIESVLSQTFPDVEYIIVDGESSDGTLSIVNEYRDRITRVISEPDQGIYDAMNKGVRASSGDVIGTLNSDDFFEDNGVLECIAACFEEDNEVDIVFGDVVFVKPRAISEVVRYYTSARFRPWMLRFGWMPPHPSTYVRKSAYMASGLYRLNYKIAADYEMFVRWLLVKRLIFRRIDKVLVRMRAGGASTSGFKSSIVLNREIVEACRSNGVYTNIPFVLSKIPLKLVELVHRPG
ncbi:MAG: glycosyltransferase [Nitrococcus sp.]|nr:glycosyltransferase [Nitrococcus sp.]